MNHAYYAKMSEDIYEDLADFEKLYPGTVRTFNKNGTQAAAVELSREHCVIVFRGTEKNGKDILTDLKFGKEVLDPVLGVQVHRGFHKALGHVWAEIAIVTAHYGYITLTGHSLGGALATIGAYFLKQLDARPVITLVTYGSPRAGDSDFVAALGDIESTRYVNCCDIVTQMPNINYDHVHGLNYIDRTGKPIGEVGAFKMAWDKIVSSKAVFWIVRKFTDHMIRRYYEAVKRWI